MSEQQAIGIVGAMPGTSGFTMACFKAEEVPVGTMLYLKPSQCLHQIQEPSAAEQAAWHAGLDEGRAQAAQNSTADVPASGAVALSEYLKTCEQHAIVPDVGGAFASAFAAGFNLAASREAPAAVAVPDECAAFEAKFRHLDLSQKPDAWGHARYSHDAISLAWEAWQARAALAATPEQPVVLPEPEAYLFQHEDTGQTMFVEAQQVEWGFEANNPRLQKISGVYTEQQLRALLAQAAIAAAPAHPAEGVQAVEQGEVLVTVSGFTGCGKSAIAGEIEIMCRALGLQVEWPDGDPEKNLTHADWTEALELYKPRVRIVECNIPHPFVKGQDK